MTNQAQRWYMDEDGDVWDKPSGENGNLVALVLPTIAGKDADRRARTLQIGRIIVAAPDMLALLEELTDIEGPMPGNATWATKVMACIAEAKGAA